MERPDPYADIKMILGFLASWKGAILWLVLGVLLAGGLGAWQLALLVILPPYVVCLAIDRAMKNRSATDGQGG